MPATLLLADDNLTTQRLIELTFAEQAIDVVTATDGQQAVERLTAARPDIVLASTSLPRVNGYEVATFVRTQPTLQGVPVLLLAGAFDALDTARVRECGAAGVLIKPFEPPVVINRVKELLGMIRPAAGGAAAPPPETQTPPAMTVEGPSANTGPANPPRHAPPALRDLDPDATIASWHRVPRESAKPQAPAADGRPSGGSDYFEQLDAAFDSLDAQLAGRQAPERAAAVSSAPRPATDAPAEETGAVDPEATVRGMTPFSSEVAVQQAPPDATVSSPRLAGAEARSGQANATADIFEALLAQEQGEPVAPRAWPMPSAASELSDEAIDRIAAKVVEKLMAGPMRDTITRVALDVSERLVREEIARLKGTK